jgi:PRTRC genetic system ThiF family protein
MQVTYFKDSPHPISIIVVGCGATGSLLLQRLGRINSALLAQGHMGIHVTVYDGDTVSAANCGRQLFSAADINQNKAVALVSAINRFYGTRWDAFPEHFTSQPTLQLANVLISCVDNWNARKQINQAWTISKISRYNDRYQPYIWMDLGNSKDFGQMVCAAHIRGKDGTFSLPSIIERYPNEKSEKNTPSCTLAEALGKQDLFINDDMALEAAKVLYKFLKTGDLTVQEFYLNMATSKTTLVLIPEPAPKPSSKKRTKKAA